MTKCIVLATNHSNANYGLIMCAYNPKTYSYTLAFVQVLSAMLLIVMGAPECWCRAVMCSQSNTHTQLPSEPNVCP